MKKGQKTTKKLLKLLAEICDKNKIPRVSKTTAEIVSSIAFILKPKRLLEIGTGGGYSSAYIASKLNSNFQIDTIEKHRNTFLIAKQNLKCFPFRNSVNLVNEDATVWLKENKMARYDFIFVDGKKSEYVTYFNLCKTMLKKGGIIIFDDVLYWKSKGQKKTHHILFDLMLKRLKSVFKNLEYIISRELNFESSVVDTENGLMIIIKNEHASIKNILKSVVGSADPKTPKVKRLIQKILQIWSYNS